MANLESFNHQVRRTVITTSAPGAGLVFGIVLLLSSDWIPRHIVAATLVGWRSRSPGGFSGVAHHQPFSAAVGVHHPDRELVVRRPPRVGDAV